MSQPFHLPLDGLHLLEASAGTGKTWTLMVLYLRQVLERRLMPDKILAVTFTNASAAEMRRRIRAVLSDAESTLRAGRPVSVTGMTDDALLGALLEHVGGEESRREKRALLRAALSGFDRARIETIHGFCQRVLAELAFGTATDYASSLSDDQESPRRTWLKHWFQARMDSVSVPLAARFHKRFVSAGRKGTFELDSLDRIAALADARPHDLHVLPERQPLPDFDAEWAAYERAAAAWCEQWRLEAALVRGMVQEAKKGFKSTLHRPASVATAFAAWDVWSPDGSLPKWLERFTPEVLASVWCAGDAFVQLPCWQAAKQLVMAHAEMAQATAALELDLQHDVIEAARTDLRLARVQRGELSFDDLLQNLRKAVGDPQFAARLAAQMPVMLIDEFQDTDPVQWAIFSTIYRAGGEGQSLYLVGDPKQAIYSFRNADLHTYLSAAASEGLKTHRLDTNYRSQPTYVEAINTLYEAQELPFVLPDISFFPVAAGRRSGLGLPGAPLTLCWLDRPDDAPMSVDVMARAVVEDVAGQIRQLIESESISADRIAVLVRKRKEATLMAATLRRYGIPAAIADQDSLFQGSMNQELVLLLRALLRLDDRTALISAMGTLLLGYTAEEIRQLDGDDEALAEIRQRFGHWRRLWERWGAFALFQDILKSRRVASRLLAEPNGNRLLTNLRHLVELLQAEQRRTAASPTALLAWLEERIRQDKQPERRLATEAEAVEVVTMHKAKGLQWDVVFCPFFWSQKLSGASDLVRYHDPSHGLSLQLMAKPVSAEEQAKQDLAARQRLLETEAEQARLLYVALTRARERCIVHLGAILKMAQKPVYAFFAPGYAPAALAKMTDEQVITTLLCVPELIEVVRRPHPERLRRPLPALNPSTVPPESARVWRREMGPRWRRLSYSGLARALESKHNDEAIGALREGAEVPLAAFPRGARIGDFFHHLFEHHLQGCLDQETLTRALRRHGLTNAMEPERLVALFEQLRSVPVSQGKSLTQLTASGQLPEASFLLPLASNFRPRDLARAVQAHGSSEWTEYAQQLMALEEDQVVGFLTGSIDLVYCHQGRWGLVDYKSNYLGDQRHDYDQDNMARIMASHHYLLQGLIYSVALLRMIRRRQPGADPFDAFDGARFFFLRGADEPGFGIFELPTEKELLLALDRCFAGSGLS